MTILSPARRVTSLDAIERAGDYWVTAIIYPDGERPQVFFLLPVHAGADAFDHATRGSGLHGVSQPPWTFRECPDGSLAIDGSIACGRADPEGEYWHGYLREGNTWEQV